MNSEPELKLEPETEKQIDCQKLVEEALNSINADLSPKQVSGLVNYTKGLLEWNSKINLISRKSEEFVLKTGIIESYSLYEFLQNFNGKMLDVGSGGGIPGLLQAILFADKPDYSFVLLDSIAKKTMVLSDLKNQLSLNNTEVITGRLEELKKPHKGSFDLIFSRGVGSFDQLLKAYHNALTEEGIIVFLTGIDQADAKCFQNGRIFPNPYLDNRLIIVLEKEF